MHRFIGIVFIFFMEVGNNFNHFGGPMFNSKFIIMTKYYGSKNKPLNN